MRVRDYKGIVISKENAEMLKNIIFIEVEGGGYVFPYIEGKTVLDQMLEAGAVIEEGRN